MDNKLIVLEEIRMNIQQSKPIKDITIASDLSIDNLQEIDIRFENVTFNRSLIIQKIEVNDIFFENCQFEGGVYIQNVTCNILEFANCTFKEKVLVTTVSIDNISLYETTHEETIAFDNITSTYLFIQRIISDSSVEVRSPKIKYLSIISPSSKSKYYISSSPSVSNEENAFIEDFRCHFQTNYEGQIDINDLVVNEMEFEGRNTDGRILAQDLKCDKIYTTNFDNSGTITLSSLLNLTKQSLIHLYNTNLGIVNLYDIDFYLFDVIIDNSNIQDIVPSNVKWCDQIETEINVYEDPNVKSDPSDLKEAYRQLKNVVIKSSNKAEELRFHNLEMTNYRRQLKDDKEHKLDRIILWLNKTSNDHGLNPLYALGWTLGFSLVFYSTNQLLLGNYWNPTIANTLKSIQDILEQINPVRKFSDVYSSKLDNSAWQYNLAKILDTLFKVISSYLIFQFITAFRKFVRK